MGEHPREHPRATIPSDNEGRSSEICAEISKTAVGAHWSYCSRSKRESQSIRNHLLHQPVRGIIQCNARQECIYLHTVTDEQVSPTGMLMGPTTMPRRPSKVLTTGLLDDSTLWQHSSEPEVHCGDWSWGIGVAAARRLREVKIASWLNCMAVRRTYWTTGVLFEWRIRSTVKDALYAGWVRSVRNDAFKNQIANIFWKRIVN